MGQVNSSMKVLITGGWGFIGGRLAQYLQTAGYTIIIASREFHDTPKWLPFAKTICVDWQNTASLELACEGVDVIIHTAGMNAQDCWDDPLKAISVNGLATEKLLQAAISRSVKRFIYLSTLHVYSNPLIGHINDTTIPFNTHPYATSHLAGENALLNAIKNGNIGGVVLRLSNAFGSPTHKDVNCWMLLVNDLCKQAVQTKSIELKSSGFQYRDFIPMQEVCRAICFLLEYNQVNGCFNLCSENSKTILDMAKLVQKRCTKVLNIQPHLITLPSQPGEHHEELYCEMTGLKNVGFQVIPDLTVEIDALLVSCKNWYSN